MSRRGFLLGAGSGLIAGSALTYFGMKWLSDLVAWREATPSFTGRTVEVKNPTFAMPGPFPGRVIEIQHPGSVRSDNTIVAEAVKPMMDTGMCALTGADHPVEAWKRLFEPGDVVGVKVNPVGMRGGRSNVIGAISSPAVLLEVVAGLKSAGVRQRDIIVFERYAIEFRQAGYEEVMRERVMDGVRWYASSADGGELQVDIEGYDGRRDRDAHVVGYDPDVFVSMGFAGPSHDPRDDRRFRSHLSVIITRMVNKIVTIPVLKDHRSAGVTVALKNLSHGCNNNVARSHISNIYRMDGSVSGPNQCNTFIPTAVNQMPLRQKSTLHICDGLIGCYEGGPGTWNRTWATWPYKGLFFATDPVALDHVGWDTIDAKRAREGWQPVAQMGLLQRTPAVTLSGRLAALAAKTPYDAAILASTGDYFEGGRDTESFDRRTPEHIILAGLIGLGRFDARQIEHRRIEIKA
jgi:uncharacterized protein (DUF362 family)